MGLQVEKPKGVEGVAAQLSGLKLDVNEQWKKHWEIFKYDGVVDNQEMSVAFKAAETAVLYDDGGEKSGNIRKGEAFKVMERDIRVVGGEKYVFIAQGPKVGWMRYEKVQILNVKEKKVEQVKEAGRLRTMDKRIQREVQKHKFLSSEIIETLEKTEVQLDEDVVEYWVNANDNSNWINIDPKGRDGVMTVLKNPPFGWSANKFRECIQDGRNHFLTFDDVVDTNGLNFGDAKEVIKKYKDLAAAGKETKELKKYEEVLFRCHQLLQAVSPDKFYYNPVRRTPKPPEAREYRLDDKVEVQEALKKAGPRKKILIQLDYLFDKNDRGPKLSDKPIQVVDFDENTYTVDTTDFARYTSGKAAYIHTRDTIFQEGNIETKYREKAFDTLNTYLHLALVNEEKGNLYDRFKLTTLDHVISDEAKEYIRKGYVLYKALETAKESAEQEKNYSSMPQLQELGEQIEERFPDMPKSEIRNMIARAERQLHLGIIMGPTFTNKGGIGGMGGLTGSIDLGKGVSLDLTVAGLQRSKGAAPEGAVGGGLSYMLKPTPDTSIKFSLSGMQAFNKHGGTAAFGGPSIDVTFPISGSWDMTTGIGVYAGTTSEAATVMQFMVGGKIGFSWNPERLAKREVDNALEKYGFEKIESSPNRYAEIMQNPHLAPKVEKFFALYNDLLKKNDIEPLTEGHKRAVAIETYEFIRQNVINGVITNIDAPFFQDVGVTFPIYGVSTIIPLIPFFSITINEETRIIRIVHKDTEKVSDHAFKEALNKELDEQKTSYVSVADEGKFALDKDGNPRIIFDKEARYKSGESLHISAMNEAFNDIGLEFSSAKQGLTRVDVKGAEDANLKVHFDGNFENTYLVYGQDNFYLAIPQNQNLIITRKDLKYGFENDGAVKEIELVIKTSPVSNDVVKAESHGMLRKTVDSDYYESGTKGKTEHNKILSYNQYVADKIHNRIQSPDVYDSGQYKEAAEAMEDAIGAKVEKETPIRKNLGSLVEKFYGKSSQKHKEIKHLLTEKGTGKNYDQILDKVDTFLEKNGEDKLHPLERLVFLNKLIEITFRDVTDKKRGKEKLRSEIDGFTKKMLVRLFQNTSEKAHAAGMAKFVAEAMKKKVDHLHHEQVTIDQGTVGSMFLSIVGTQGVTGVRRSLNYEGDTYKLLGAMRFSPTSSDKMEARVARATLELLSPLKTKVSAQEFINQPLALKVAKVVPVIFSKEETLALASIYKNKIQKPNEISSLYNRTYKKFRKLVTKVRSAELGGFDSLQLGPEFNNALIMIDTRVFGGLFEKCENYTMVGRETIAVPAEAVLAGAKKEKNVKISPHAIHHSDVLAGIIPVVYSKSAGRCCCDREVNVNVNTNVDVNVDVSSNYM